MKVFKIAIILAFVLSILFEGIVFSADHQKEFNEISKMDLKLLTFRTKAALDKKYPWENWGQYQ
jgi:hypothetical protein